MPFLLVTFQRGRCVKRWETQVSLRYKGGPTGKEWLLKVPQPFCLILRVLKFNFAPCLLKLMNMWPEEIWIGVLHLPLGAVSQVCECTCWRGGSVLTWGVCRKWHCHHIQESNHSCYYCVCLEKTVTSLKVTIQQSSDSREFRQTDGTADRQSGGLHCHVCDLTCPSLQVRPHLNTGIIEWCTL